MIETDFHVGKGGQVRIIWAAGEVYLPQHINQVFRSGSTLHVWDAIYRGYKFPLYRFKFNNAQTVDGKQLAAETMTDLSETGSDRSHG